jgi:hypothetical protein
MSTGAASVDGKPFFCGSPSPHDKILVWSKTKQGARPHTTLEGKDADIAE